MDAFKKFKSKFTSSCKSCGSTLNKGDDAMIAKHDKTWIVICEKCHADGHGEKFLSSPDYNLEEALNAAKRAELGEREIFIPNSWETISWETIEPEKPKEIDPYTLPFEKRIKFTAKWIIKDE